MGRLTWKNPDGTWGLNNMDIKDVPKELYGAVCKLKDYEETGLMPERMVEMDELYTEKCKEVAKLQKELERTNCIKITELSQFITDVIFEEKETILEAFEKEDRQMLEDEIYYGLESCAEDARADGKEVEE